MTAGTLTPPPATPDAPPADAFLWGVATSGYQSEGGYNGSEQPHNNWCLAEANGAVMRSGHASDFWTRYEDDFRTARQLGLNAFRLSLEWSRVQPTIDNRPGPPPPFDRAALDAYADRVAACRRHGLEPVVTLHHFTHPAWLGPDAWLTDSTVDHFAEFVRVTVAHVNRRLAGRYGLPPIRWYITINEPNILVLNTYLGHQFPSGADPGRDAVLRAYNRLLSAHVRAYNAVHDLHRAEGWPAPRVSLNTYCSDLYWSDKFLWDLLCVRRRRIKPARLRDYVYRRSQKMDRALLAARLPFQHDLPYLIGRVVHFVADHLGYRAFDRKHFAFYLKELFASPRADVFDFVGLDYYDPFTAHAIRLPTFADLEFETRSLRTWLMEGVTRKWWDWRSLPEGLHFFCKYYSEDLRRPVLIAENGMAHRRKPDNSFAGPRGDLLTRSAHLELHVKQVCRLVQEGVPLLGYLHWSLMDNYEWGSFTPRFGLFTIDYAKGTDRLAQDHVGDRPSETYARLVREACGLPAVPAPRS